MNNSLPPSTPGEPDLASSPPPSKIPATIFGKLASLARNIVGPLFSVLLFSAAGWLLFHELHAYHLHEILRELHALPSIMLWAAIGLTFCSYMVMTAYDALALHYVGHPLPYRKIGIASFISYAFSNNIGLSMLAGASVRYRLYSAWGLSGEKIATIVFFCTLSLWLGFFAVGGVILTLVPMTLPAGQIFSALPPRLLGLLLLAPVTLYLAAGLIWKRLQTCVLSGPFSVKSCLA